MAKSSIARRKDTWLRLLLRWWREGEDSLRAGQSHDPSHRPLTEPPSLTHSQLNKGRAQESTEPVYPQHTPSPGVTGLGDSFSRLAIRPSAQSSSASTSSGSRDFWARLRGLIRDQRAARDTNGGATSSQGDSSPTEGKREEGWESREGLGLGEPGPADSPALERLMQLAQSPTHLLSPPVTVTEHGTDGAASPAAESGIAAGRGEGGDGGLRQPQSVGEALLLSLLGYLGPKDADPAWEWVFDEGWRTLVYESEGAGQGAAAALWAPRDPTEPWIDSGSKAWLKNVYAPFQREKRKANAVDFDDLLVLAVLLLRAGGRDVWGCPSLDLSHVLVDEFQDTDAAQYEFIRLLTTRGTPKSLFVVGDMDQAIYGFRGADPSFLQEAFDRDYPDCLTLQLPTNYRWVWVCHSPLHPQSKPWGLIERHLAV